MNQPTYTLDQARLELRRLECVDEGHRPYHHIRTIGGDILGHYQCECGEITWGPLR